MSAPKVSLKDIEDAIVGESYTLLPNGRTTVCQLTLDNGFTVEGQSACVSIENYNEELGNKYARERAIDKVWQLLGFRLADSLMGPQDWFARLQQEREQLADKIEKLDNATDMIAGAGAKNRQHLGDDAFALLCHQLYLMKQYLEVLDTRIQLINTETKH